MPNVEVVSIPVVYPLVLLLPLCLLPCYPVPLFPCSPVALLPCCPLRKRKVSRRSLPTQQQGLASAYATFSWSLIFIRIKTWCAQPLLEAFQLVPCCPFALLPFCLGFSLRNSKGGAQLYNSARALFVFWLTTNKNASARVGRRSQPTQKQGFG